VRARACRHRTFDPRDASIACDRGIHDRGTNYVEHPELVAQRIRRFADVMGRERIIAGTDCGMGTFAGFGPVHTDIAWAKLRSLTAGAALASA
jgi:5-methyltetrahydropteroyltriglutamate--homocysteine methyltransferase